MIRVEGHKNLYRDENSGAIINCDFTGYDNYVRSLKSKEKEKDEIKHTETNHPWALQKSRYLIAESNEDRLRQLA